MEKNTIRLVERFQWPLAFALWCLLVSFYYEFPVRPRPRDLKLTTETAAPKSPARQNVTALILFALLAHGFLTSPVIAASESPETPELSPLAKIVTRLSSSPQPSARDWAELARETVTWGSKLLSGQQPVPEGPIRDALTAVDLGSTLDPKTADWPKLREELEALLKNSDKEQQQQKNEEKKQDEQQQKQQDQEQKQQNQDQQKQDSDQQQNDQSQQQKEQSKSDNPAEPKEPDKSASEPDKQQKESAFGDMKKNEQPPPPPTEDTQQVGGAPKDEKGEPTPIDPNLAVPLQKLDQLKNQDSPAELFKLMEGDKDRTPRKKTKDW